MNTLKIRASVEPEQSNHEPSRGDSNRPNYRGVDSREEVLRQLRDTTVDIIDLDPNSIPSHDDFHYVHSAHTASEVQKRARIEVGADDDCDSTRKKRRLSDGNDACTDVRQIERQQSNPDTESTLPPSSSTIQHHTQNTKKSLWYSSNAEENMSRMSGLPSPESLSSDPYIESSSSQQPDDTGSKLLIRPSWSFEDIDEPSTTYNSNAMFDEPATCTTLGTREPYLPSYSRQCDTAPDPLSKKWDEVILQGITESRRLREENQRRKERVSLVNKSVNTKHSPPKNTEEHGQRVDYGRNAPQFNQDRNHSSVDAEEEITEVWRLRDNAEEDGKSQYTSSSIAMGHEGISSTHKISSGQFNPFSRSAAEKWRTQDRHLGQPQGLGRATVSNHISACNAPESSDQDKEMRMARVLERSRWKNLARMDREAEKRLLSTKFHGVDLRGDTEKAKSIAKPKPRPRMTAEVERDLQKVMGTTTSATMAQWLNNDDVEGRTDIPSDHDNGTQQIYHPRPSLSKLKQLSNGSSRAKSDTKVLGAVSKEVFDKLPEYDDVSHVPRPKMFSRYSRDEQKLFLERACKRDREKDLDLISSVFTLGAQLGSLEPLDPNDPKTLRQLSDIRGFAEAILNQQKSGKSLLGKMRSIRDMFKRRLDAIGKQPDDEAANNYLPVLLQPKLYDKLISEIAEVKDRLPYLATECNRINSFYHNKSEHRERNTGAALLPSNNKSTGGDVRSGVNLSSTPSTAKQKLAQLRSTLSLFDEGSHESEDETEVIEPGPSRNDKEDGEISEEDEGEAFMRSVGLGKQHLTVATSKDNSQREQDGQKQANTQTAPEMRTSQSANQHLLRSMLAKQRQKGHLETQGVQRSDLQMAQENWEKKVVQAVSAENRVRTPAGSTSREDSEDVADYDVDEESSQEFADSDLEAEDDDATDDENEDDGPRCKRYIVKGACYGLSPRYDADEYLLGNFLSKQKARERVLSFAVWVKRQILKLHPELDEEGYKESTSDTKTSFEQKMAFSDSEKVSSRAWIEEEFYSPSEEAYKKAKVSKACQANEVWFVDWERVIKPYEQPEEDSDSHREPAMEAKCSDSARNVIDDNEIAGQLSGLDTGSKRNQTADQDEAPQNQPSESSQLNGDLEDPSESSVSTSDTLVSMTNGSAKDVIASDTQPGSDFDHSVVTEDQDDDYDDLFGPLTPDPINIPTHSAKSSLPETLSTKTQSPTPSSKSGPYHKSLFQEPTITRATGDHIRLFTNIAHANRHAKEVFMRWYIDHLPGISNQGFIEHEDAAMEEELRRIGNRSCWSREEEFEQERDGNAPGEKVKVVDGLKVWVRKGKCFGPSN